MEGNLGFKAGIARRSKVQRLAWVLKAAPPRTKDLRLNSVAGISEGRRLRDRITAQMQKADAKPEDAKVLCVFAKPDLSAFKSAELTLTNGASDLALASKYVDALPIGFLIFVWDKTDAQQPIIGHIRPLIVEDPRANQLNVQALLSATEQLKRGLMEAGVIQDERN